MHYLDNCSSFVWLLFFGLLTFRIKFKWLLMVYKAVISPWATFLTSFSSIFSPADSAPATLTFFLFSCTFPHLLFHTCCFLCLLFSSQIFVWLVPFLHVGFCSSFTSFWKLFFLSVKFRMTWASYCMGILNYIHIIVHSRPCF